MLPSRSLAEGTSAQKIAALRREHAEHHQPKVGGLN